MGQICLNCGTTLTIFPGGSRSRKFCSNKCLGKYYSGENSPHWKGGEVERTCIYCGKNFFVRRYKVIEGYAKFCNRTCMGNYNSSHYSGKNSFNFKGDAVIRVEKSCKLCNKIYKIYPSEVIRSKFCSKLCLNIHNFLNSPKKETSLERIVREWLEGEKIEYIPQKLLLRTTVVDFFIEPNIAVYCDGSYWHSKPYARNHDAYVNKLLLEKGFEVLRLQEGEIKDQSGKKRLISVVKGMKMLIL